MSSKNQTSIQHFYYAKSIGLSNVIETSESISTKKPDLPNDISTYYEKN